MSQQKAPNEPKPSNTDNAFLEATESKRERQALTGKLMYDIFMLIIIIIDLTMIGFDAVMMSSALSYVGEWIGITDLITQYKETLHTPIRTIGGFFTVFLIFELVARWLLAIINKTYYRWFFFPFVHWYEVLGCFPQLRALRLLRAFIIGRNLYKLGYQVVPQKWIDTGKFYYTLVLEELSDRVILTATGNFRSQIKNTASHQAVIQNTIDNNSEQIKEMIVSMLHKELAPRLQQSLSPTHKSSPLAVQAGEAIQDAIIETPELQKYLKMIPIAGTLIESQILSVGQKVGENVVNSVSQRLLDTNKLDELFKQIAEGVTNVDINNPAVESLLENIIEDGLTSFEEQVKVQQWKHKEHMHL